MLVLSRKPKQRIVLSNGTDTITIVMVKFNRSPTGSRQVRIGVDAPQSFHILREELITDDNAD